MDKKILKYCGSIVDNINAGRLKSIYSIGWLLIFQFLLINNARATSTYYSISNGEWDNNVWSTISNSGASCSCSPGNNFNKVANVSNKLSVSTYSKFKLSGNAVINVINSGAIFVNSDMEITGGSTINISYNDTVIVNGNLKLSGGSNINVSGYFLVNGNADLNGNSSVCGSGTAFLNGTLSGTTWCGGVLPIKLVNFKVNQDVSSAKLSWETATEINSDYYKIERSADGIEYEEIIRLAGAGNSNKNLFYSAIDNQPLEGISYYRLKQFDFDGNFETSRSISFEFKSTDYSGNLQEGVSGPNPFSNDFNIDYSLATPGEAEIQILNSTGKIIFKEKRSSKAGINSYRYGGSSQLQSGTYNLRILSGDEVISKKIIKN